ncbi:hypothetical protein SRHO_G00195680 [Serrasalmus rhombeus]
MNEIQHKINKIRERRVENTKVRMEKLEMFLKGRSCHTEEGTLGKTAACWGRRDKLSASGQQTWNLQKDGGGFQEGRVNFELNTLKKRKKKNEKFKMHFSDFVYQHD